MKNKINKYQVEALTTLYKMIRSTGATHKETVESLIDVMIEFGLIENPKDKLEIKETED